MQITIGSTPYHFVKYRLGVDGVDKIMEMVGEKIIKLADSKDAKLDSTPLEASRYDQHSDFNPHYGCKMDKAHITMIGTYPVFMTYTNGLAGDSISLTSHIAAFLRMKADIDEYRLDGSYDSFLNHADIWYKLKAEPLISLPVDAVINKEGELGRINHWMNRLWKLGGSKCMKIGEKLKFLYENGRQEQVGRYLRNQNLEDKTFPDLCKLRSECERIHWHIKKLHTSCTEIIYQISVAIERGTFILSRTLKNTVKFDVRRVRNESRELYSKINLVIYQLLLLTNLQNHIKPANSFENYI
ncbi:MAG: hypothetical protein CHKLHMKO_00360 [Candidatus Argoarchaeum ethanivorans]|uniref:Transposase IS4-like domain-containing protein n=1 Tax=Candidatus Argoarchaeum ethanivorans TaxID=2608793 RepID=A0A811TAX1_9EURY|nr:MAG: hypothetical protein CHKLHMKO_00360 [Candidatus Argoarchaeum ethanivorans]